MAVSIDPLKTGTSDEVNPTFTTLTVSGDVTLSGGTANGVAYLNGSKVLTTGSALTFDSGSLVVDGDVGADLYYSPWGDDRQLGGMGFNATYYTRMVGNASTRELRLEAGGATGDPAAVNVRIGVDGTPVTVASFGPSGLAVTGSIRATVTGSQASTFAGADGVYSSWSNLGTFVGDVGTGDRVISGGSAADFGVNARGGDLLFGTSFVERLRLSAGGAAVTGYIAGAEQTAPAAPAANGYRIFAQDNGAGKTQLMVIFASGAAQQIAIEP